MTNEEKYNLLYRPEMSPEEDYMSDAEFIHRGIFDTPLSVPDILSPPRIFDPEVIRDDLQEIIEMFPALPEPLQFYKPTIEKIKKRLEIIIKEKPTPEEPINNFPSLIEMPIKPKTIKTIPTSYTNIKKAPKGLPSIFPDPAPINIRVVPPKSIVEIVKADYARDQIHLDAFYTQRLQLVMQKYFQRVLAAMADCGIENIDDITREFDADSVKIPLGQSLEHLRDHIARSQVSRGQKERYFKKTHSVDKTLLHLRAWHVAEKARERYYEESYGDSGTFAESHSNAILRESRAAYDSAYASSLYNMFRYLDSSTSIMNDTLEMTAKEAEAKSMLIKKGVNIFETDETDAVAEAQAALAAEGSSQASENAQSGGSMSVSTTTGEDISSNSSDNKSKDAESGSKDSSGESTSSPIDTVGIPAVGGGIFGNLFGGGDTSDATKYGPNGKKYEKNDIEYLTKQGYSKEQAIEALSKDDKYTTPYKGPNGRKYSQNDVDYLVNQGHSKDEAYQILSKDDKYTRKRPWDELGKSAAAAGNTIVNNIINNTLNGVNDVIEGKSSFEDLGKNISAGIKSGVNDFTKSMTNYAVDQVNTYATDWITSQANNGFRDPSRYAPNGKKYEKNDIKYLTDRGFSKKDACAELAKHPKYTEPYRAPNGRKYSQNDVDYLISQGCTKEQAYEILSKDDKYTKETEWTAFGKSAANCLSSTISENLEKLKK